jgi:malate permease and related proteins
LSHGDFLIKNVTKQSRAIWVNSSSTLLQLIPILGGFVAGHLLRRLGITEQRDGEMLFKLVFYLCVPALMFVSLSQVELTRELLALPALAACIVVGGFLVGSFTKRWFRFSSTQAPLFVIACMIVNSGFSLPFVQTLYGHEGVAALATFDAVNSILTFTLGYSIAARANPTHQGDSVLFRKLLKSPPLYGIAAGVAVNLAGWTPPSAITTTATTFGTPTGFLVTLAIGTVFTAKAVHLHGSAIALVVRLTSAVTIGLAAIWLLGLKGTTRDVVLLLSVAPVGFNTVTFASLEKLDIDFASSTLSLSIVVSLLLSCVVAVIAT